MKIGVVSDTHNNHRNVKEIVRLFNSANVGHVVHTGDITRANTLELFRELNVPLSGVYGNNDTERTELDKIAASCGFEFIDPPLAFELEGKRIVVVHDPRDLNDELTTYADLALHGHTHLLRIENLNELTIFNPGECAGHMKGFNAIGIVDLESMSPSLLNF